MMLFFSKIEKKTHKKRYKMSLLSLCDKSMPKKKLGICKILTYEEPTIIVYWSKFHQY